MTAQVTETFFGKDLSTDCDSTFQSMLSCYQDPTQCGGTATENPQLYASVHSIFDPYVAAGVMTANDILRIEQLIYAAEWIAPTP